MSSRLLSLLIWAAVAASAFYWGLRLLVKPIPVPGQALVASVAAPLGGDLSRLLGTPPAQPLAAAAPADSRFKLIGVVAPRFEVGHAAECGEIGIGQCFANHGKAP